MIDAVDEDVIAPSSHAPADRAVLRTALMSVALVAGSCVLFVFVDGSANASRNEMLTWWSIALIAIASEAMVFHVEFRRQTYTFTFSEIPMVLGLFLASPTQFVVGRLLGEALYLVLRERQGPTKLSLNLASFLGECAVLLIVFQMLGTSFDITQPSAWGAALVAVCVADLLGFVVVATAVRWHGGPIILRPILSIGALTAPVNASFALITGILLVTEPAASLLLVGIAAFLVLTNRAHTSLQQRFESLSLLYDFTRLVSGAQRPEVVLASILSQAKDLLRAERAEIWLADDRGGYVSIAVDDDGRRSRDLSTEAGRLISRVFVNAPDAILLGSEGSTPDRVALMTELGAEQCIVAPVTEGGAVVGLVAVTDRLGETGFRHQDAPMFATLANHASVALENGRLIERLNQNARQREHESLHDSLTGLPNRVLFNQRLTRLTDEPAEGAVDTDLAVAVMDLDGFKEINDTLGHHAGDRVLVETAKRIRNTVEADVTVARLGGDEFALLFPSGTSSDDLERTARMIQTALGTPMHIDGVRINVGISIGFALAPDDATEASALLQRADVAMYGAKAGFGEGVNFYSVEGDTNTPRRLALTSDLAAAISNGQLVVLYQPKLRFADGEITGFEALVRWEHPEFGLVGPDEFIPIAERTGTIQQLTEAVLGTAVTQLVQWRRENLAWGVSVNLSMRNLMDPAICTTVRRLLDESGVEPAGLTLELTESSVMSDTSRTISVLEELARSGVKLSIDDFGTGYSSLAYLQRLPVDEVKIDKSFVLPMTSDPAAEAIVRSILDLARNMHLRVVAEGVEDRPTWELLGQLGCHEGQGHFMGSPVAPTDLAALLVQVHKLGLVAQQGPTGTVNDLSMAASPGSS